MERTTKPLVIEIANCTGGIAIHVKNKQRVQFKSGDSRSYVLKDHDGILQGSANGIQVPAGPNGPPSEAYVVDGTPDSKTTHPFPAKGDPKCTETIKLPPGIIIDI